ncbi:MAG: hydrolase TatD, partial [Planctomycetes bacterium RBG_16_64_10]
VGTTVASSQACTGLATKHAAVYAAVGIQPNCVAEANPGDWDRLVQLAQRPKVVAVGETGLDRHWDYTPFGLQQEYFQRHLQLARQCNLPVIVHMRDCPSEMLDMLRQAQRSGPLRGIMHAFTGDADLAAQCVALGLAISFAGMVTFKKCAELRACAATVPANQLVVETDSPYLAPTPVRGQRRNEPANLPYTAACLAALRGQSLADFATQTTANARRLFGL